MTLRRDDGVARRGRFWAPPRALAAWLFLRKLRPPRMLVPSLLLWRRVLDEPRELTLWERIRRAVSLVAHHPHRRCARAGGRAPVAAVRRTVGIARPSADRRRLIVVDAGAHAQRRDRGGSAALGEARRLRRGVR